MMLRAFVSPADVVPEQGQVWLFVPQGELGLQLELTSDRGAVPHQVAIASRTPDLTVVSIHFQALGASAIELRWGPDRWAGSATLKVDRAWSPPATAGVEILERNERSFAWSCSHQATADLRLARAGAAFRLIVADTADDYRQGNTRSLILPGKMAAFFSGEARGDLLELGHVSCFGSTVLGSARRLFVGVQELFADGSASPLPARPVEVDLPAPAR
jgi:hypothetical protein